MPAKEETGDRYQLQGEIARGGMGAVLRGRDVDLGRDLAVKVLLEKHVHRPEVARRFMEEAQIGGQLQHPGVVPVYDIGRFGERPFFTMKVDAAIASFKKAIELDPKYANCYCNWGYVLRRLGRLDEAIACCQRAIELDPKSARSHGELALAFFAKGRYAEARDANARALNLFPAKDPLRMYASRQLHNGTATWPASATRRRWRSCRPRNAKVSPDSGPTWQRC
jgi:hypothetical protein